MTLYIGHLAIDLLGVQGLGGRVGWFGFGFERHILDDGSEWGWSLYGGLFALEWCH